MAVGEPLKVFGQVRLVDDVLDGGGYEGGEQSWCQLEGFGVKATMCVCEEDPRLTEDEAWRQSRYVSADPQEVGLREKMTRGGVVRVTDPEQAAWREVVDDCQRAARAPIGEETAGVAGE
jgi:hypothetical protein